MVKYTGIFKNAALAAGRTAMSNVSVLGAGTWGIALAAALASNGLNVTVWSAIAEEIH